MCSVCEAGFGCLGSTLEPVLCDQGYYSAAGDVMCMLCPAGFYCPFPDQPPQPCQPGMMRNRALFRITCLFNFSYILCLRMHIPGSCNYEAYIKLGMNFEISNYKESFNDWTACGYFQMFACSSLKKMVFYEYYIMLIYTCI